MNRNNRAKLEKLLKFNEYQLHAYLVNYLKQKYKKPLIDTHDYIIAEGDIPVCLVAHLDVVSTTPPSDVFYDAEKEVMFCVNGFGQDDRSGVFAILKLIEKGHLPSVIFTHGEEIGCVGANALIERYPTAPFDLKYMIQLDRRGDNDCVFYDCENIDFQHYVESFGFVTDWGSFTDISVIAPAWGVAAVNLSTGYYQEHSQNEHLNTRSLINTIKKVDNMLTDINNSNYYEYIPSSITWRWKDMMSGYYGDYYVEDYCDCCYTAHKMYELNDVTLLDGSVGYLCDKCYMEKTLRCTQCGEDYEVSENNPNAKCPYCNGEGVKHARIPKYTD